jgi:hypothetical protein
MREELDKKLCEKYPKIFRDRNADMKTTAMCWGFSCGDGWYLLIDKLCSSLQWDTDTNKYPQVIALQVKEKFGTLRFYYSFDCSENAGKEDERTSVRRCSEMDGAVQFAESMSSVICMECGNTYGTGVKPYGGWYLSLCDGCGKERIDEVKK